MSWGGAGRAPSCCSAQAGRRQLSKGPGGSSGRQLRQGGSSGGAAGRYPGGENLLSHFLPAGPKSACGSSCAAPTMQLASVLWKSTRLGLTKGGGGGGGEARELAISRPPAARSRAPPPPRCSPSRSSPAWRPWLANPGPAAGHHRLRRLAWGRLRRRCCWPCPRRRRCCTPLRGTLWGRDDARGGGAELTSGQIEPRAGLQAAEKGGGGGGVAVGPSKRCHMQSIAIASRRLRSPDRASSSKRAQMRQKSRSPTNLPARLLKGLDMHKLAIRGM